MFFELVGPHLFVIEVDGEDFLIRRDQMKEIIERAASNSYETIEYTVALFRMVGGPAERKQAQEAVENYLQKFKEADPSAFDREIRFHRMKAQKPNIGQSIY